jgi:hypothetical protein
MAVDEEQEERAESNTKTREAVAKRLLAFVR